MPNRILREGILSSERIVLLNWQEEVFYRRLMSVVDDFGRYHANPKLLRAAYYPLLIDKVSDSDIGKWLTACVNAELLQVYEARAEAADQKGSPSCGEPADGSRGPLKPYLQLLDFRQQARADKSRFPAKPIASTADAQQVRSTSATHAPVFGDEGVDEAGDDKETRPRKEPQPLADLADLLAEGFDEATAREFIAEKAKRKAPLTVRAWKDHLAEAKKAGWTPLAAAEKLLAKTWKGFEAKYVANERPQGNAASPQLSFYEREQEAKAARMRELAPYAAKGATRLSTSEEFDDSSLLLGR